MTDVLYKGGFIRRYTVLVLSLSLLVGGPAASASGTYEYDSEWGGNGSGRGQFDRLEYGGGQYILVIDEWNYRVQKFVPISHDYIEPVSFGEIKASVK